MKRTVWAVVGLLVLIGVIAAVGRSIFPADLITRFEPVRQWLFDASHRTDPFAAGRAAELAFADGRFAAHPVLTYTHIVFGGLFLLFAPLQFSRRFRQRFLNVHRWMGRALLVAGSVSVLASLYFGLLVPYGGPAEAVGIALFGGLFLFAAVQAFVAIRRKEVARHREWMIRAFAIALAISTVRLIGAPFDLLLTPTGMRPAVVFVIVIWVGWTVTVGTAELWIRHTRPARS